jgi:CheY-like chemotaxis protein
VNLLTNAAKYTPPGGRIQLAAGVEDGEVVIRVRDNGIGISPEILPRLFDLFAQADRSLARSEGGLGIGLTVAKTLTEMQGGTLAATSDGPGTGSEFVVRFPAAKAPAAAEGVSSRAAESKAVRRLQVLVVDDNVDTAKGMAKLLRFSGHDVRVAICGVDAIEAASDNCPELVLLDIGLPGMDGYEVAKKLRREICPDARLIAISGYGDEETRRRTKEAGFDHQLVKPVDFDALISLLNQTHAAT